MINTLTAYNKSIILGSFILLMTALIFVSNPIAALALPVVLCLVYLMATYEYVALATFCSLMIALQFETGAVGKISLLEVAAGVVIIFILLVYIFRYRMLSNDAITKNRSYLLFLVFFGWMFMIGCVDCLLQRVEVMHLVKETFLWAPMLIIPILYEHGRNIKSKSYIREEVLVSAIWVMVFVWGVLKIKKSIAAAIYLFEMGRANFDLTNASFMFIIFLSLAFSDSKRSHLKYYYMGILVTIVGIVITFNRTSWIAILVFIPFLYFLSSKDERIRGRKVMAGLLLLLVLITTFGYFTVPLVKVGLLYFLQKFQSAGNVGTDVSFINRFFEWRDIWSDIVKYPITGYGMGATYKMYNWIGGVFMNTGYTHNTYLGILFKSGVVGFVLLMTAYFRFMKVGIKLTKSTVLSWKERAYVKACIVVLAMMLLNGMTFNLFAHREVTFYIGMIWAYLIVSEKKVSENQHYINGKLDKTINS